MLAALTMPLSGTAVANHDDRLLEVSPERTIDNPAGTTQTLTAKLCTFNPGPPPTCDPKTDTELIQVDFEIESGPGDISGGNAGAAGNSPNQPDMSCPVLADAATCTVQYTSTATGTDIIRAWIDHDGDNASVEADTTEGRVSNPLTDCSATGENAPTQCQGPPTPGTSPGLPTCDASGPEEPDCTDVVEVRWIAGTAAILDCTPETATNPSTGTDSDERYTCSVTDANGNAKSGIEIEGENLAGVNDPDNSAGGTANTSPDYDHQTSEAGHFCTTESNGTCSDLIFATDGEAGDADICFWADIDSNDAYNSTGAEVDGGRCPTEEQVDDEPPAQRDLTDKVRKTWQARSAAQGGVDAEPETDTNDLNSRHTITGTVYDQFGQEFVSSTTINFELFQGSPHDTDGNTPASPDETCTTNNASNCSIPPYPDNLPAKPGTDLWCVWINATPTMTGNNTNGTCDGEGLNDADDAAGSPDAPQPANDDQDVVQKIWADPGAATNLDCSPETDTNPVGTAHTITCKATNAAGTGISGANVDGEVTGANDPDNGNSPTSPDFTCNTASDDPLTPQTNEAGNCTFTHGPGGTGTTNSPGLTTYRFWIDADKDNATTTEADASEGRDETATAGATQEPDGTDVVEKSWVSAPASLSVTPETDTANVGQCNAYTITVLNAQNQPAQGATIDVEQRHALAQNTTQNDEPRVSFCTPTSADGPNPSAVDETKGDLRPPDENPDNVGTAGGETVGSTDAQGKITIGIRVEAANNSDGTGTVNLSAFFETTDNDDPDSGEPQDTATKTWTKAEPRTIDCEPETDSNDTGTNHTVTCTVEDRDGNPVAGEGVTFTEEGPGEFSGSSQQTTNSSGEASATVTSEEEGDETITGTLTDDTSGNEPSEVDECDRAANDPQGAPAGVCSDSVTKTWVTPAPPECDDGVDNDGDGKIDHPDDPGCESPQDDDETDEVVQPKRVVSDIKGFDHGSPFTGKVTSSKAKCERGRTAVVKKVRSGKDKKIGSDRTNRSGAFKVDHRRPHGDGKFYAQVKKKTFTNDQGRVIICTKARSKTITVR